MNDFDGLLATDFGFKPQGKAAPMAASKGSSNITTSNSLNFDLASRSASQFTRNSNSVSGNFVDDSDSLFGSSGNRKNRDTDGFGDLFGGSARFTSKSESLRPDSSFNLDSMFHGSRDFGSKSMNSPVYDKPVYDDDIFDGVSGLKTSSKVKYDEVFASVSSAPEGSDGAFDDLLGGFGRAERESKSSGGKRPEKNDYSVPNFDDLIPGFGGGRPPSDRPSPDIGLSSEPTASASRTTSSMTEDPFKVFESKDSSSGHFTDPLEEISKFSSSRSTKNDSSLNSNGRVYDGVDPFDGLGKSVPAFSSERNNKKDSSRPRTNINTSWTQNKEPVEKSSVRSPEKHSQNKILVDHNREFEQMPFDMPAYSSDYDKPVGQRASSPSNNNADFGEANVQVDMSPKYEENLESYDNLWLTVSEIPLFTQPTTAPPPSRPPPPRPVHVPKSGTGSASSTNIKKKATEFSSFPSSTQFSQGLKSDPAATRASSASQFDELEDFAMGRSHGSDDELGNGLPNEELEINSAAAAMNRAEAKFRHAKEVRGRENTKAAKSREAVQEDRGKQERLDRERQQQDRKEKERRRLEKEREGEEREREQRLERERERAREFEREREKARQAVERATREARERAAAEARLRAERAAVEKANAEARERAERAAVQRAQAEARERAAAEAKERVERAAQARERANTEAKEKEARERAAAARAEAEARVRAEKRAAVERATAETRERAAAAVRMNNQKNENDLESFFSMGTRTSSAPRPPRANSSDSLFDTQFQPDTTRKSTNTSSGMKKASSSTNIVDDLSSIFGAAPSSGEFQEVEGESEERRRARLERHQRAQERAAKALAEKNQRDLQTQREQAERHRLAETLDSEIKRWAAGKEGNLRALLSTLQYVLWPECGWQPVSLTDLITAASVKKVYRKATLCIHPDKVQQKGANLQQKYISEKVFDILKEAWNKFNSEELF